MPIGYGWRMASPRGAGYRFSAVMPPMRSITSAAAPPARLPRRDAAAAGLGTAAQIGG